MKTKIPCKFAVALALLPGLTASLPAQTAAPATISPGDSSEQPVVLETFTVNTDRDQGYIAVDSLAGGRQNTPLRVTPSAVSSLTKEFINDLAVTDLQDALQWSLNVTPTNFRSGNVGGTGGDTHNFWSVSVRGDAHVQGGNPPTKNYFPTFMIIDTYNVERIEINSGPNSILFGIGDIGGSLTTYTKVARFDKTFQDLTLRATSFGGYRVAGDVNQTVGNLAVRVNAVWADEKGWRDGEFDKRKGVTLAASYKFGDNTQLR
ncbi:MAG TPA: TonB-dependent receptor plug domain-containing protein, partial [Opitutus sp.]|nr:TonB-dependent receptor plug domain-containing protein [Opitutus sp.]